LSLTTFGDGYATPKAVFDYLWAIWRVKAAALLRHYVADFSPKNQALTRKIARPQFRRGFGEPESAPKPFPRKKGLNRDARDGVAIACQPVFRLAPLIHMQPQSRRRRKGR
jgi:hypothetical protein